MQSYAMSVSDTEVSKSESAIICDVGESDRVVEVKKFERRHHRMLDGATKLQIVTARLCSAVSPTRLDVSELLAREVERIYICTPHVCSDVVLRSASFHSFCHSFTLPLRALPSFFYFKMRGSSIPSIVAFLVFLLATTTNASLLPNVKGLFTKHGPQVNASDVRFTQYQRPRPDDC